jgi:APA family basic amino acid/polyamine antiporter
MVGASAYLLPSTMGRYGPISLLGWLVAGAGALSLAAVFARMGRIMPAEGGHYAYTREAFGDFPAFLVAWGYWVSVWVGNATIATAFVGYLTAFVPAVGASTVATAATALGSIWLLTALNVWGLREAALFQLVTTVLKVLPLLVLGTVGLVALDPVNLMPFNQSGGSHLGAVSGATVFALWAFLGFESCTVPAEEVEDAERTIPRVTMLGTLATALVYVLSTLAVMGVMSAGELVASSHPMAEAAGRMWGSWAGQAVAAGAALAGFAVLNGWVLMQGQMPLAPARDGLFPAAFARLSPRGTPTFGLIVSSGLCTLLVATNYARGLLGLFEFALLLATVTVLVPYAFTALAQIVLILREPGRWGGPDRGRALVTSVLGLAFSLAAIVWSGWSSVLWGGVLLAGGVPFYLWSVRRRASRGLLPPRPSG